MFKLMMIAMLAMQAAPDDAAYTKMLDERVGKIVNTLKIDDLEKSKAVHQIIVNQYRGLRDIDDAKPKEERAEPRAALHTQFLAKLGEHLNAQQIEAVKDGMTYGTVKVTYDVYCQFVPTLTDEQKTKILDWLKEARELAMDGGSQQEKVAIFGKYKGKINNYLAAQGIDMKKAEQDFRARQRSATRPSN